MRLINGALGRDVKVGVINRKSRQLLQRALTANDIETDAHENALCSTHRYERVDNLRS